MKKSIYQRKTALRAVFAVLAICGTLSVSAATTDPALLDLTTSDTTHKNSVTNNGNSKKDTIAIGFDNTVWDGGLAIGSNNTVSNAASIHLATAIGRNNTATTIPSSPATVTPASAAVPSLASITMGPLMQRFSASILNLPVALQLGMVPDPALSRFLISPIPQLW